MEEINLMHQPNMQQEAKIEEKVIETTERKNKIVANVA